MNPSLEQHVDFIVNAPEARAASESVRNSVLGVGDAAEQTVQRVDQSLNRMNNAQRTGITQSTRQFNGLQNSMNQISRELPAFTFSMQTGFMAISNNLPMLADEIGRIRAENAALTSSGQASVPVWRQVVNGLLSWQTAMSLGITLLTVYGKEIGNLVMSLFKGKEAFDAAKERISSLNKAIESTDFKRVIMGVEEMRINIDLAKRGLIDKKDVLDQYNKTIGNTTGQVRNLDQAEAALAKNADAYVKMTLYKAAANLALEEAAKKALEVEQSRLKKADEFRTGWDKYNDATRSVGAGPGARVDLELEAKNSAKRNDDRKKAAIKEMTDAQAAQVKIAKDFQEKAAQISSGSKFDFFGNNGKDKVKKDTEINGLMDSRKDLLDKLAALDDEYARKSFTKDDEEVQALRDKFKQFRAAIDEENAKLAKYNKTHKKQIGLIDVALVAPIEQQAMEDLTYRQQTEKLKTSLNEQKGIYAAFEEYKNLFGLDKAQERYKSEIDVSKTYLKALTAEYNKLLNDQDAAQLTGVQKERLKYLSDALKQEQQAIEAHSLKLLSDLQGYQDKRMLIQENAIRKVAELNDKHQYAEADNQRKKSEAELTAFDKGYVEQMDSYKRLFNDIDKLSTASLRKNITGLQKEVSRLKLTPEAKEFFDKMFGDLESRADANGADDFKQIASSLDEASRFAGAFSDNLSKGLSVAGNLAGQVGNIKQGMANFSSASGNKDVFGQISAGIGVFSAFTGVLSGIAGIFDNSAKVQKEREEALQRQVQLIESVNKRMREQIELNKELLGDNRVKGYAQSMADVAAQIEAANKKLREQHLLTGTKAYDDMIQNNDASFFGTKNLNKAKEATSLAKLTEAQIKDLYDQGKLDARAKAAYDSMIELRKQQKDLLAEMNKELTGVDFSGVLDGFADLFKNSEPTIEDFAKFFENTMQEAAQAAFRRDVLEESLKDWYNSFSEASKDGLTSAEKDALQADYNRRVAEIQAKAKDLEAFTGTKLGEVVDDSSSSDGSLSGAFRNASQESIDLLAGQTGGMRLAQLESNNIARKHLQSAEEQLILFRDSYLLQVEIAANTFRTAENTEHLKRLENVETSLANIDQKMDNNLQALNGTGRI